MQQTGTKDIRTDRLEKEILVKHTLLCKTFKEKCNRKIESLMSNFYLGLCVSISSPHMLKSWPQNIIPTRQYYSNKWSALFKYGHVTWGEIRKPEDVIGRGSPKTGAVVVTENLFQFWYTSHTLHK